MNHETDTGGPLCFVLMPFGRKPDAGGREIDFDAVYAELIKPAVDDAGLGPIRADEEAAGGIIHKPMFERLLLCEYAVADLTTANANVYYELGVRHAARPWSTVLLFAEGTRLPFDLSPMRAIPYRLNRAGAPAEPAEDREILTAALRNARDRVADSPVFQLVDGLVPPDISRLRTDVFRDRVAYSEELKGRLAEARETGIDAIRLVASELGPVSDLETGVAIDLLLSYRAVKAWPAMIELTEQMAEPLARSAMVREQYALALNRAGEGEKAERVLLALIDDRGPSSETLGILGRVYKDRWQAASDAGQDMLARGLLDKAIGAYLKGFETDWRDAYPGINAVTLMELRDPPDPRQGGILPVVTYSVKRRIESGEPDYWDHATLLELAVLSRDPDSAAAALADALASVREVWEPETTLRNLQLIRNSRETRGEEVGWLLEIERELAEAATN
jgi:tetratricopeptide (TPR) repeat protein